MTMEVLDLLQPSVPADASIAVAGNNVLGRIGSMETRIAETAAEIDAALGASDKA